MINKKKILIIIACILIIGAISFLVYYLNTNKQVELTSVTSSNMDLKEEVIPEIKEEVVVVAQDTTTDSSLKDLVSFGEQTVEVPKSTVAPLNSSEDAERNKKKGGKAVSQSEAESMFENVGTKSFGIDVSQHQGKIDWAAVKASGVEFAMIRCGFRGQTAGGIYEDTYFKTNVNGATAAGIKVGIYFYSTAVNENEALEEAAWVVKKISTYRITYPVVYDFEDFGAYRCANVNGAQATSNALTFLNFVQSNGYEPMMYANKNDITTRMSRSSFSCKFWLAHYTTQTDYTGNINMWQYTSKGSVPGISGNVDMNIAYFSYGGTADAKHSHNYTEVVKNTEKPATCTQNGSKVLRCSCGDTKTETIPATGHKFGTWVTTEKATTEKEGLMKRTCSVCNAVETKTIEKLEKPKEPEESEDSNTTNTNTNTNTSTNTNTETNTSVDNSNISNTTNTENTDSETPNITENTEVVDNSVNEPVENISNE